MRASPPADPPEPVEEDPAELQPAADDAAASSPGSSAAADDPFLADRGQPFDADQAADEAAQAASELPDPPPDVEPVLWTPERIRRLLSIQGHATHAIFGVSDRDWVWQPAELDLVCDALSEYANRTPVLAALAHVSDEAAIAAGFFTYAMRSYRERVVELRRRQAEAQQPITGQAPDYIDPEDHEWTV